MVVVALRSLAASQPRLAGNPLLPHLRPRYPYPPRTNFRASKIGPYFAQVPYTLKGFSMS